MLRKLLKVFPYFFIAAIAAIFVSPALWPPPDKIIQGWDLWGALYYARLYLVNSLKAGVIPYWDPYSLSGVPFLAHPTFSPYYPPYLLFFVLPINTAFSVFIYLHLGIAGITMFRLVRKITDDYSALFAASVFTLTGFMAARIFQGNLEYITAIAWMPLVFDSFKMMIDSFSKKRFLTAVFSLYLQLLAVSGTMLVVIFTLELCLFYLVFKQLTFFRSKWKQFIINIVFFLTVVLFSLGLMGIILIPGIEYSQNAVRGRGLDYGFVSTGSYSWDMLKLFWDPFSYGDPLPENFSYHGPWPNYFEFAYFVGKLPWVIIGIYLVVQAIKLVKKKKTDPFFIFCGLGIVLFALISLGNNFWLHKLIFDYVPFYKFFRIPARHMVMVVFLVPVASAVAVSKIKYSTVKIGLILLVVWELLGFSGQFIRLEKIPELTHDRKLIKIQQEGAGKELVRVFPHYQTWDPTRHAFDFNAGGLYNLQTVNGYHAMILNNYYHFFELINKSRVPLVSQYPVELPPVAAQSKYLDFLNIKYVINPIPSDDIGRDIPGKLKTVYVDPNYKLYENLTYSPRFYLVKNAIIYKTEEERDSGFREEKVDLKENVIYTERDFPDKSILNLDCSDKQSPGEVQVVSFIPNGIVLKIKALCNSILSTSEVFYPAWEAKMDKSPVKIYQSNVAFRSIPIPKGEHILEFYYNPRSFYIGGGISLLAGALLLVFYKKFPI